MNIDEKKISGSGETADVIEDDKGTTPKPDQGK